MLTVGRSEPEGGLKRGGAGSAGVWKQRRREMLFRGRKDETSTVPLLSSERRVVPGTKRREDTETV